jgi:hypothetical protein
MEVKEREEKRFFFEKKKQKTFGPWGRWRGRASARRCKSFFASFFSKKEALSSLQAAGAAAAHP